MRAEHSTLVFVLLCSCAFSLAACARLEEPPSSEPARGVQTPPPQTSPQSSSQASPQLSPQPSSQAPPAVENAGEGRAIPPPPQPPLLSRQAWGASEPLAGMKPHTPSRITVHHTAEPQRADITLEQKMRALQNFSQRPAKLAGGQRKPAWPDVPYHFYIDLRGQIAEGRDIGYAGDTNTDYDPTGHALIVLEGNFEKEQPTPAQLEQLTALLRWLSWRWQVPASEIKGHSDYAATACPGKNLKSELPRLRESVGGQR